MNQGSKVSRRRTVILGLLAIAGLAAWRYRVLQVGSFLAAAGVRKFFVRDTAVYFRALALEWQIHSKSSRCAPSQSRGVITYHPWYDKFRPEIARHCLAQAAELGAGYIRIDIRWKDLLPDGVNVDEHAWDWYENYLTEAHDCCGLESLIVLSNAPDNVLRYSVDSRLEAWTR